MYLQFLKNHQTVTVHKVLWLPYEEKDLSVQMCFIIDRVVSLTLYARFPRTMCFRRPIAHWFLVIHPATQKCAGPCDSAVDSSQCAEPLLSNWRDIFLPFEFEHRRFRSSLPACYGYGAKRRGNASESICNLRKSIKPLPCRKFYGCFMRSRNKGTVGGPGTLESPYLFNRLAYWYKKPSKAGERGEMEIEKKVNKLPNLLVKRSPGGRRQGGRVPGTPELTTLVRRRYIKKVSESMKPRSNRCFKSSAAVLYPRFALFFLSLVRHTNALLLH